MSGTPDYTRLPVDLCRRTTRHQAQQLSAEWRRLGRAIATELNRWIPVRPELLTPLVTECSECGADL